MKTIRTTLTALAAALVLAACTADAQTTGAGPGTGYGPGYGRGPGWRHQQQVSENWQGSPGPMMMGRGPMMGRNAPKLGADGKVDPTTLPPWCPYYQAPADQPKADGK